MTTTFTPAYPALQTHGQTVQTFVPPKTRFIQYEKSDEDFCVYAGIATYKTEPVALWDVREHNGNLLGYTRHNPNDALCQSGSGIHEVRIMEPVGGFKIQRLSEYVSPAVRRVQVRINTMTWSFKPNVREEFVCWFADLCDAEALARGRWLECVGDDNIEHFTHELARKAYREYGL